MFGIGMPEMLMILVVALVVVGPKRLPELAQTIGRAMGKLRAITSDFQREIDKEIQPVREINPFADAENNIQPPQAPPIQGDASRDTGNPPTVLPDALTEAPPGHTDGPADKPAEGDPSAPPTNTHGK